MRACVKARQSVPSSVSAGVADLIFIPFLKLHRLWEGFLNEKKLWEFGKMKLETGRYSLVLMVQSQLQHWDRELLQLLTGMGDPWHSLAGAFPQTAAFGVSKPFFLGFEAPAPSLALCWVPGQEQHLAWPGRSGTIPRQVNPEQSVLCSAALDLNHGLGPCPAAFHKH